jgi:hypothetical protein
MLKVLDEVNESNPYRSIISWPNPNGQYLISTPLSSRQKEAERRYLARRQFESGLAKNELGVKVNRQLLLAGAVNGFL